MHRLTDASTREIADITPDSPLFRHFQPATAAKLPAIAARFLLIVGDSPADRRNPAMIRSPGTAGFEGRSAPVASSRLIDAVAATLAIGALSLCLVVTITVFSIKVSMAMPIPA
jgi:hypothetical protein